jgi:hypothetical protein
MVTAVPQPCSPAFFPIATAVTAASLFRIATKARSACRLPSDHQRLRCRSGLWERLSPGSRVREVIDSRVKELRAPSTQNSFDTSVSYEAGPFLMSRESVPDVPTTAFLMSRRFVPEIPIAFLMSR